MQFIEYKEVVRKEYVCNHPAVEKFWQWGAFTPTGNTALHHASVLLKSGERHDFKSEIDAEINAMEKLDDFLKTLPCD